MSSLLRRFGRADEFAVQFWSACVVLLPVIWTEFKI